MSTLPKIQKKSICNDFIKTFKGLYTYNDFTKKIYNCNNFTKNFKGYILIMILSKL